MNIIKEIANAVLLLIFLFLFFYFTGTTYHKLYLITNNFEITSLLVTATFIVVIGLMFLSMVLYTKLKNK